MHAVAAARTWRLQLLLIAAVLTAIVLRCFPRPIEVPGRSGGVEWVLVPVMPAVLASLLPALVRRAFLPLERVSCRFGAIGRLAIVATATGVCGAAVAGGVGGIRLVDVRNCGLAVGIALLSVYLVPTPLGWSPVVLLGVVTWLIGVPSPGESAPSWALLLAPASSKFSLSVCVAVFAVATATFLVATPRSGADDDV